MLFPPRRLKAQSQCIPRFPGVRLRSGANQHQGCALIGIASGVRAQGSLQQCFVASSAAREHFHATKVVDVNDGDGNTKRIGGLLAEPLR